MNLLLYVRTCVPRVEEPGDYQTLFAPKIVDGCVRVSNMYGTAVVAVSAAVG